MTPSSDGSPNNKALVKASCSPRSSDIREDAQIRATLVRKYNPIVWICPQPKSHCCPTLLCAIAASNDEADSITKAAEAIKQPPNVIVQAHPADERTYLDLPHCCCKADQIVLQEDGGGLYARAASSDEPPDG
jgi:hypothetical protein